MTNNTSTSATTSTTTNQISFSWRFEAGFGKKLMAYDGRQDYIMGGDGVMYPPYSSQPAPEWVQAALKRALPILSDWKPEGYLGANGYWVGEDIQSSPAVKF